MNKQDALNKLPHLGSFNGDVIRVIDEIYNSIEFKICLNCTYYNAFGRCTNGVMLGIVNNGIYENMDTFGCNKFKLKETT